MTKAPIEWAAVLDGDASDLRNWEECLRRPGNPWVEKRDVGGNERYVLHSSEFEGAESVKDARNTALAVIQNLNGAVRLARGGGRVTLTGALGIRPDGKLDYSVHAELNITLDDITAAGPENAPSRTQQWYEIANSNELVADILNHLGKSPDWIELYKAYECLRELAGGGDDQLLKQPWSLDKKQLRRFTHTANYYRHGSPHPARKTPPPEPMSLPEALNAISWMVRGALTGLIGARPP